MHGFINSPALAKLVALQMVDEELQRSKSRRPARRSVRARLLARRTSTTTARASRPRVSPSSTLAEETR